MKEQTFPAALSHNERLNNWPPSTELLPLFDRGSSNICTQTEGFCFTRDIKDIGAGGLSKII